MSLHGNKLAIALVAMFLVLTVTIPCQGKTRKETHFSNFISLQDVTDITQDRNGNIWIATLAGLNRYNGYEYEHFPSSEADSTGLPNNFVFSVLNDNENDCLWVGTMVGLSQLDYSSGKFRRLGGPAVYSIFKDSHGRIWTSTPYGPWCLETPNSEQVECKGMEHNVNILWEDESGRLWAGSDMGLEVFREGNRWDVIPAPGNRSITSIYIAPDKNWWLGTDQGILFFDPALQRFMTNNGSNMLENAVRNDRISFIKETDNYRILAGTAANGIFYYDLIQNTVSHDTPERFNPSGSRQMNCCFIDNRNTVWIGTYDKGFTVANTQSDAFCQNDLLNKAIRGKFVTRITCGKDGSTWISARYGGIFRYEADGKLTSFDTVDLVGNNKDFLEVIYMDSKGRLWIAFESCLILTEPHNGKLVVKEKYDLCNVRVIKENPMGGILAGTWRGLYKIDGNGPSLIGFENMNIADILFTSRDEAYVSVFKVGVFKSDSSNIKWEAVNVEGYEYILWNCITMAEDDNENLWFGSYGNGMLCIEPDGNASSLSTDDGLLSNNVICILNDRGGNIWVSTSVGIAKISRSGSKPSVSTFDIRERFPEEQYHEKSGCMAPDGRVFFGGNHGLTYFNPSDLMPNTEPPMINLEGLRVFNENIYPGDDSGILGKTLSHTKKITLSHNQRTISIEYSGIDFLTSNNLTYQYILEGFDKRRNIVGTHRMASYSNLPPGNYTFKVWAVNESSVESKAPATLDIVVKPAIWMSWQAYLLYILLIGGITTVVMTAWIRSRRNEKRVEMERKEKEREQEISKMKTTFYSNISHELRTPLSLIVAPSEQLLEDKGMTIENRHLVEVINRNANYMIRLTSQLMDYAKIENGVLKLFLKKDDIVKILKEEIDSFFFLYSKKAVRLSFQPHSDELPMMTDKDKVEKIVSNLLSNALKHTPKGGRVDIFTRLVDSEDAARIYSAPEGEYLEVSVKDSGTGIDKENLDQLFVRYPRMKGTSLDYSGNGIGLHYTKNLVEKMNGRIIGKLNPEGGMLFSFILPLETGTETEERTADNIQDTGCAAVADRITESGMVLEHQPTATECAATVMIVEDNPELREYLGWLIGTDYKTVMAENGKEAWELLVSTSPDIVISDVIMPNMSGTELCRRIKNERELSHIPVILLTAKATMSERIEGLETGADAYIPKPFSIEEVKLTIQNMLRRRDALKEYFLSPKAERAKTDISINQNDRKFIEQLSELVEKEISNPDLSVDTLTTSLGFSRTALYKKIKGLTGLAPNDFIRSYRFKLAAGMLVKTSTPLAEISDMTGFSSYSYFSRAFKLYFGVSPKEYRFNAQKREDGSDSQEFTDAIN